MANFTCSVISGDVCNTSGDITTLKEPTITKPDGSPVPNDLCGSIDLKIQNYNPSLDYYVVNSSGVHKLTVNSDGTFSYTPDLNDTQINFFYKAYTLQSSSFIKNIQIICEKLDIFEDGSCVALYTFDGNANDKSGNYNGTWVGNEQYVDALIGQAAKFDGSSYITVANDIQNYFTGSNHWSVSVWVNWEEFKENGLIDFHRTLIINNKSSGSGAVNVYHRFESDGNGKSLYTTDEMPLNEEFLLTLTYDGSNYKLYFNDQAITLTLWGYISSTAGTENLIAKGSYSTYVPLKGSIDQLRVFNRALTASEVSSLYTNKA